MSKRRAALLIAGLVILVGIACLIYVKVATPSTPASAPAASTPQDKVYTDPDSKLSFKYPHNWIVTTDTDDTKSKDIFIATNENEPLAQLQLQTGSIGDFSEDQPVDLTVYTSEEVHVSKQMSMYAICASYPDEEGAIPVIGLSRYDKTSRGVLMSTLMGSQPAGSSPYQWISFELTYEEPPESESAVQAYCQSDQAKQLAKIFASLRLE